MARFRPGVVPTVAMLLAVALLASLGTWQVRRHFWRQADLAEKTARIELPPLSLEAVLADPEAARYRRATATGRYDHASAIAVTRVRSGIQEGARVLTPLLVSHRAGEGGQPAAILVDRGWVPYSQLEQAMQPADGEAAGEVQLTGLVFPLAPSPLEPGSAARPRQEWMRFDPGRPAHVGALQAQLSYRLEPVLLQRAADETPGWPRGGFSRPESPVNHVAYAITWYGAAVAAVGVWIGVGLSNPRRDERGGPG